jgi:hypothetical protein
MGINEICPRDYVVTRLACKNFLFPFLTFKVGRAVPDAKGAFRMGWAEISSLFPSRPRIHIQ